MTKNQLLSPYAANSALRLCLARLLDQRTLAETRGVPTVTAFLTPEERAEAEVLLKRLPPTRFVFFGGFIGAERQLCAFLPDWMDEEDYLEGDSGPLCALELTVPPMATLSHRDYLGSLMALGISREKFGDIICMEHRAHLLLQRELVPILKGQWERVGRYPVTLCEVPISDLSAQEATCKTVRDTVATLRLDSVVAAGFSMSRSRAAELINAGRIQRNHRVCDKSTQLVEEGDLFACRGMGRFLLRQIQGKSRKDRIILELDRYE